ncbi:membrane frizzled-related protein [Brachionichthys hirsutus]|uniref:membrane frizzled-related protein n=1 Tax=Brachionichthys hirsutus TaxID=412623 RepID=UPI00360523F7
MSDLSRVAVFPDSSDLCENVFFNPAFELGGVQEERMEGFRTSTSTPELIKAPPASWGLLGVCVMHLRAPGSGWGVVVVSAAALLLLATFGLVLALILTQLQGQAEEGQFLATLPSELLAAGGGSAPTLPPNPASQQDSAAAPQPTSVPPPGTACGGVLTDSEGSFSSPNHPGAYPPNSLCVWVIRVPPPSLVQIHVSSLAVEGPSPCLFDWLEVQEQKEQISLATRSSRLRQTDPYCSKKQKPKRHLECRKIQNKLMLTCLAFLPSFRFCGNVAPPTVHTNSSTACVTFRSDSSIAAGGFVAHYKATLPGRESCSRGEFTCDDGLCLLPVSVCDGRPDCPDRTDEASCSHKHAGEGTPAKSPRMLAFNESNPFTECGGQRAGAHGFLSSPNHPGSYPHQQVCVWHVSVEEGHAVTLSFRNFSLETQDLCEFDYVEVHDGIDTHTGSVLGRFCGPSVPPDLTSSGPHMTVVFVADDGVSDSGFNATYRAVSALDRSCGPSQFACSTGECLNQQWACDGWNDCPDGADEKDCGNSTYPPFTSPCELIEVEMCQGLSYNRTSFPNIWLSVTDQKEASALLRQYRVLKPLACFEPLRRLVCGMFLPRCSPQGGVLQPCRSVCSCAEQQCRQALRLFSFSWPFNCHLLTDSQDPEECSLP